MSPNAEVLLSRCSDSITRESYLAGVVPSACEHRRGFRGYEWMGSGVFREHRRTGCRVLVVAYC